MKIKIIKLGKPAYRELSSVVAEYGKRLRTIAPGFEAVDFKSLDDKKLIQMLEPGTYLVALDERGKEFTSPDLAKSLTKWMDDPGIKQLIFLIGDPYGISKPVIEKANLLWAVSKGTLPSDLAWVVATEQIYRAFTLIKGIPYHHE